MSVAEDQRLSDSHRSFQATGHGQSSYQKGQNDGSDLSSRPKQFEVRKTEWILLRLTYLPFLEPISLNDEQKCSSRIKSFLSLVQQSTISSFFKSSFTKQCWNSIYFARNSPSTQQNPVQPQSISSDFVEPFT